jgi:DNA-binding MarR family transcriptional regulator
MARSAPSPSPAVAADTGPAELPTLAAIERAMTQMRRRHTRRALGDAATGGCPSPVDLNQLAVVDALDEGPDHPGQELTVGVVAERLGIDPSRASRVVCAAVNSGYVLRVASQGDGRRICLELTEAGRQLVAAAHSARQAFYDRLLDGWTDAERGEFARLLTRFAGALGDAGRC